MGYNFVIGCRLRVESNFSVTQSVLGYEKLNEWMPDFQYRELISLNWSGEFRYLSC